ncbi:LysR family transcriptional regulator [Mesorhizobium vachelliae]
MFEALGRFRSIEHVASEFGRASDIINRQIKAVEEELGLSLIATGGTRVTFTRPGRDLYRVLADTFCRTSDILNRVKRGRSFQS